MLWIAVVVFLAGLVFGSFLNVCIHRLPKQESIVGPRSHCPHCSAQLRWWENVPVFSFLLLGGKCRHCRAPISWIYPIVELLTAVLYLLLYREFDITPAFFVNALFFSMLVVLMVIDLYERILPNVITVPGILVGLALSPFQSSKLLVSGLLSWPGAPVLSALVNSVAGVLLGGGFLWLVGHLYFRVRKIEGMGFGDVKMMAMVGAFIGWQLTWLTIFLGSFLGALLGSLFILLLRRGKRYELPFGTFLAVAAIVMTIKGPEFLAWYYGNAG